MSVYRNRYCAAKIGEDFVPSIDHAYLCDVKYNKGSRIGYLLDHLEFYESNDGYVDHKCWDNLRDKKNCPSEKEIEQCKKYGIKNFCVI